jgi:putative methionine-R-sulfoxide reductase with GAF domain
MPIDPAHLARSLGALDILDVEQGVARTLQQVLRLAKTLLDADRVGLMLVDPAGALRWAGASDGVVEAVDGELDRLAQGPCRTAFAQRAPAAVPDFSAEPGWRALTRVGMDEAIHAALSVPVQVGGGPVGTLDVYVTGPRAWDDSEAATANAWTRRPRLSGCERRPGRRGVRWSRWPVRWSVARRCRPTGSPRPRRSGTSPPTVRLRCTAGTRVHEGAARRYERDGQVGRAQTERLQAAAARGRITDAEAERHRADQQR